MRHPAHPATRRVATRWALVLAGTLVLISLPVLRASLPAGDDLPGLGADALVAAVRASADVPHRGYAVSSGTLAVPELLQAGALDDLLSTTRRLRVWWAAADRFRVDDLGPATERSTYADPGGSWDWDPSRRQATRVVGEPGVRVPRNADVLPDDLGRRLLGAVLPGEATRLPPRRVAGRTALGVRVAPADERTTVATVDVWADRETGLPLQVEVTARGQTRPSLTSRYLEVDLGPPDPEVLELRLTDDTEVRVTDAPDVAAQADAAAPYLLPPTLAGLPRSDRIGVLGGTSGVATYGEGLGAFVVLPLPRRIAADVRSRLGPPFAETTDVGELVTTPLAGLAVGGERPTWLVAGTVDREILTAALLALTVTDPPPRRAG